MGQIQNAINQIFTSSLGMGLAINHSPYMKERAFQKEGVRRGAEIKERLGQLQAGVPNEPTPTLDPSQPLPIAGKINPRTHYKPENALEEEANIIEAVSKYETDLEKQAEVGHALEKEAKAYTSQYKANFQEQTELSEEYNTLMARLGKAERLDLGEISKSESELARKVSDSLRKSYTTVEGIKNAVKLRRQYYGKRSE